MAWLWRQLFKFCDWRAERLLIRSRWWIDVARSLKARGNEAGTNT